VCGDGIYDWDETFVNCPQDVPGCDLPDMSLSVLADGSVLYNTSQAIGGFQFMINGATLNGAAAASGGAAGDDGAEFTLITNPDYQGGDCADFGNICGDGMVLGISLTGTTIPPGCGILVELDFTGTPNNLHSLVIADENGIEIPFTYSYPAGSIFGCMDGGDTEYGPTGIYTDDDDIEWACNCITLEDIDDDGDIDSCDCYGNAADGIAACNYNPDAIGEYDPSNDTFYDCAYLDYCGTCDTDPSNDCEQDCAGTPNGTAVEDNCGTCDDDPSNDCVQDCAGVWGGDTLVDECGVCGGDNSSCADCAGVPNGESELDNCGICNGDGCTYESDCDLSVCMNIENVNINADKSQSDS
jgi:hypothetical protein